MYKFATIAAMPLNGMSIKDDGIGMRDGGTMHGSMKDDMNIEGTHKPDPMN